jgi:hypothetical protein
MVVYEDGSPDPVRMFEHGIGSRDPETFGEFQLSHRTGDIAIPRLPAEEPLAVQLREFIAAVRRGRGPDRHLRLARDVIELVEAAEDSLQSGGIRIPVRDFRVRDLRDASH